MSAPLAYHITWHTYGTWLPGHEDGWVQRDTPGVQAADEGILDQSNQILAYEPVSLDVAQREIVRRTIVDHCAIRDWALHASNPRTTHVHVVVTADRKPEDVLNQLKSWCSRRLNTHVGEKRQWWAAHGSTKWINDEEYFQNAVHYVLNLQ